MILNNLEFKNFRNLQNNKLSFSQNYNCVYGYNAQGKTNFLESIYFLLKTKSFREENELNLINKESDFFKIAGTVESKNDVANLAIVYFQKKKKLKLNGKENGKKQYLQQAHCILFCWEDLFLVEGHPQLRREFLDSQLSCINLEYYTALNKYKKALQQRNKLLKLKSLNSVLFHTYEEIMAVCNEFIIKQREIFLNDLKVLCQKYFNEFLQRKVYFEYSNSCKEQNSEEIIKIYANTRAKEKEIGFTLHGIHRDDFFFMEKEKNFAKFSSLGEKKMLVLILKIMLAEYYQQKTNKSPILLLDDLITDFDSQRESIILNKIFNNNYQCFLTFLKQIKFPLPHLSIQINEGLVKVI